MDEKNKEGQKLRNVLLVSFFFNQKDLIGTVRLRGLAKFLPLFGWNPIILTTRSASKNEEAFRMIETPFEDPLSKWKETLHLDKDKDLKEQLRLHSHKKKSTVVDLLLKLWEEVFSYPDLQFNWFQGAVDAGDILFRDEKIDAIISSSSPATSHLVASELKIRHHVPWIADFRDLWTQNHYYPYSRVRKYRERRLEQRTMSHADAITTVSCPYADKLTELHQGTQIHAITNGFDPESVNPGCPLTDQFSVTYTGLLYKGRRDPEPLFKVIREMIENGEIEKRDLAINFFGPDEGWLLRDVEKNNLNGIVRIHGVVSREQSILKQRESQVLLLLTWDDPDDRGVYTGKVFDYLAARRPILSLGYSGGVVTELLDHTHAGVHPSSDDEIKKCVMKFYQEYKVNGYVQFQGIQSEIDRYSHVNMARKFVEILDRYVMPGSEQKSVISR